MAEDERWWVHDDEKQEESSKETVEDAMNKAESEKIQRGEEMAEARHELELARIEAEKKRLGTKDSGSEKPRTASEGDGEEVAQPPMVTGNSGVLGLWWLSEGEAFVVAITSVLAIAVGVIWTLGVISAPEYTLTTATIEAEVGEEWTLAEAIISGDGENGTGWFEDDISGWYEDCYTDDEGYEWCDSYWAQEYECYADLYLKWSVDGTEYDGWAYTPSIITEYPCLEIMEDYYQIGDTLSFWHISSDPSDYQVFSVRFDSSEGTFWEETLWHWVDGNTLWSEYVCEAELRVTYYAEDGGYYTSWVADGEWGGNYRLFQPSGVSCISGFAEEFGDGQPIEVMVNYEEAYMVGFTPMNFYQLTWICCVPIFVLLAIVTLVFSRLSNTPPGAYVTNKGVYYHQGYDGNDVVIINNQYGRRWGLGGSNRGHRRTRRISSGRGSSGRSRSSGGGRSTRGSSGGGGRSSGGGRSGGGGGRSGGGRGRR